MKNKLSPKMIPLRLKLSGIFIMASILIFVVNVMLMYGINNMSVKMDRVYRDNLALNELSGALDDVQNNMTEYLFTKTTDSLEDYYKSAQNYKDLSQTLNKKITGDKYDMMEHNIRYMSEQYLTLTDNAIEAKRKRNVEEYSMEYDKATQIRNYIDTYINSLNNERFKNNSIFFSMLIADFRVFEIVSMIVMFVALVGSAIFVIAFTSSVTKPVNNLAVAADEVAKGNFEIETLPVSSNDELGVVTGAFNKMVVSIRQYIEQIKNNMENERRLKENELKMETSLKDAQLKYLQAQINPHFLFNTLNAGAQLAMMEDAEKTYNYIQNTAAFFRYNVREGNTTVTLDDEINLIDHYIYILNVRFSGDIKYEKNIESKTKNVPMPSMILQPIVENSINHGIKEMEGRGKIILHVYEEDDEVYVSVKDNGTGMTKEMIDKVLSEKLKEEEKPAPAGAHGIGMDNVIKRIRLFTGREDSINILSEGEDMGTEVIIRLKKSETVNV